MVTSVAPIAKMVGVPRIVRGSGIPHPIGDPRLTPEQEKALRRVIMEKSLEVLQVEPTEPTEFLPIFRNWLVE